MAPRYLPLALLAVAAAAALLAACGGGEPAVGGQLTDPRDAPTATAWPEPPEPTFLDPSMLTPAAGGDQEGGATPTPAAAQCGDTYTVQPGDVPSGIAERCGVTTQALLDANPGVDPHNIHAGDVLKIPR